jgi:hypothetical protein
MSDIGCITLLDAVTATGVGSGVSLQCILDKFTYSVVWSGTNPTNTVVSIDGSIDGITWEELDTLTVTSSGKLQHIVNKGVMVIRANYVSKSGGDSTTAVTVKCIGWGG